jgi:hypothetical protein
MPLARNLIGTGSAGPSAQSHVGEVETGVVATGSTSQANSYGISRPHTVVATTGANTGVRLMASLDAGDNGTICNKGASTLFCYPPSGGAINGGSADAKVDIATTKAAVWVAHGNGDYTVVVGA